MQGKEEENVRILPFFRHCDTIVWIPYPGVFCIPSPISLYPIFVSPLSPIVSHRLPLTHITRTSATQFPPIPTRTVHRPADAASPIFTPDYHLDTNSHSPPIRTTTHHPPPSALNHFPRHTTDPTAEPPPTDLTILILFHYTTHYHHNPPDAAHFLTSHQATPAPPRRTHDRRRRSRCQGV